MTYALAFWPSVPDSSRGRQNCTHLRSTKRRVSTLSNALITMVYEVQNSSGIGFESPMRTVIGLTLHSGLIATARSAATSDFMRPASFSRKRNCLDKLEFSMESKSVRSRVFLEHAPDNAKNFRSSQPNAPAPTKKTFCSCIFYYSSHPKMTPCPSYLLLRGAEFSAFGIVFNTSKQS